LAFLATQLQATKAQVSPFTPLEAELPDPNESRLASGAPGPGYWQQRADYKIQVVLDDEQQRLIGKETITYHNNSPHSLPYVWLQLDQNLNHPKSLHHMCAPPINYTKLNLNDLAQKLSPPFQGGYQLDYVNDANDKPFKRMIYDTMMRIDLLEPLAPGKTLVIKIAWQYNINDATISGRSGYEYFEKDKNYIYEIAQFFPRMCAYTEFRGWQNTPFGGRSEFALEFGNYEVDIIVPADHVVAATGGLINADKVLNPTQLERLAEARKSQTQTFIITFDEAKLAQQQKAQGTKTWQFAAKNERDFAFASSRKFLWDAATTLIDGKPVLVQSFYPPEAVPLWDKYATHAATHTLQTYSRYTLPYPYSQISTVHGAVWGMEYPMLTFCGGRPEPNGNYTKQLKYSTISVIIHETGHSFFPMIVNSDERRWAWMDEGLNSFLQYLTEQEFEPNYPSRRGRPGSVTAYMSGTTHQPIMTRPDVVLEVGNNAYGKVAAGLNILRETIIGRADFDFAFKTYANRWAYKHPEPCDLFRTFRDATGRDLDWFWRGWFFGTDKVDIAIKDVVRQELEPTEPMARLQQQKMEQENLNKYLSTYVNDTAIKRYYVQDKPFLQDNHSPGKSVVQPSEQDEAQYQAFIAKLQPEAKKILTGNYNFYTLTFTNEGGMIMPLIYRVDYSDGSSELFRFPAEVWMLNNKQVVKDLITDKFIVGVRLDPFKETADCNTNNNLWPNAVNNNNVKLY